MGFIREGLAPEVLNVMIRLCLLHILKIPFVKIMRLARTVDVSPAPEIGSDRCFTSFGSSSSPYCIV